MRLDHKDKCKLKAIQQTSSVSFQYFNNRKGVSNIAPELFSILIKCCQTSLGIIMKDKKGYFALSTMSNLNYKILESNLENSDPTIQIDPHKKIMIATRESCQIKIILAMFPHNFL